ncbi:MAG: hypothetical protein KatS3mg082_1366 [Nitrospiraceae bacterium]|nr:MAG: hypothetical protein KatS3mg082_1366 [Nitrospiraceae bacterium]
MALPPEAFCDTSFFYACLDPKDVNHARARALAVAAATSRTTFCSTWDIVSETVTLLRYRRDFRAALAFLEEVKPGLRIIRYGDRVRGGGRGHFQAVWAGSSVVLM